jgi:uncharacterized delta-60 repeat protein
MKDLDEILARTSAARFSKAARRGMRPLLRARLVRYSCAIFSILLLIGSLSQETFAQAGLDQTFGSGGKVMTNINTASSTSEYISKVLLQPDGKLVAVGYSSLYISTQTPFFPTPALARYNSDGTLDSSFGNGGIVRTTALNYSTLNDAALQPDGKIVAVGTFNPTFPNGSRDYLVVRYNSDGNLDTTFSDDGYVILSFGTNREDALGVALQSDGKIVVVGNTTSGTSPITVLVRYNTNGTQDLSFGNEDGGLSLHSPSSGYAIVIQPDDKIIIGGSTDVSRLNSNGTIDSGFGSGGHSLLNFWVNALALQADGRIVAAGETISGGSVATDFELVRLLTNGFADTSFGTNGRVTTNFNSSSNDRAADVLVQPDGRIVAFGTGFTPLPEQRANFALARYTSSGVLQAKTTLDFNLRVDIGASTLIQPDGKIVVAGYSYNTQTGFGVPVDGEFALARYVDIINQVIPGVPFDFDGDRRGDIAVFRPLNNVPSKWYVLFNNGSSQSVDFGILSDRIVPADYDGDARTDFAVFRPSSGVWYTSLNPDTNYGAVYWGMNGDVPVPGDYDRDGKADRAVYRPSNGTWYILNSSDGSFSFTQFGSGSSVLTVPADYDGDGKTDLAYISLSGNDLDWNIRRSSDNQTVTVRYGIGGDRATPADYDGDGDADIAVFRPSTGRWYTSLDPVMNYGEIAWGQNGDIPAPADYDGDGKTDVTVFRPSNGSFYIRQSTNGALRAQRWGQMGDVPVASAYTPGF